ncbi:MULTISPECIES: antibiotic biosynthesis monooxygenase family protein [Streptomyces]|uniref:antibiotic biosynthesis monooxygenase family protein n=1 Tax=Streptomyces TaxID=1883 RepID=UPI000B9E40C9|nr:antibiotic biosynthesis monooxygenase family protein [Streptomyces kasugaensis]
MPVPEPNDIDHRAVTFVNRFTLRGSPEEFEAAFAATSEFMRRQSGFRWHSLLAPVDGVDGPQYVNIAVWQDEVSFRAAVAQPEFPAHAAALRTLSTSEPTLYRIRQVRSASVPERPACEEEPKR